MGLIWILRTLPETPHHGGYLRFINLARLLAKRRPTHLIVVDQERAPAILEEDLRLFVTVNFFPKFQRRASLSRLFRTSNRNYLRKSNPQEFNRVVSEINKIVSQQKVDTVIGFTVRAAEYADRINCTTKVLDDYDCATLTAERYMRSPDFDLLGKKRISFYLQYLRNRQLEKSLTCRFDIVTTISKPDQSRLQELSSVRQEAIHVVKNGVDPKFLHVSPTPCADRRSIVFWGNLAFPPNIQAIRYFFHQVFSPYLAELNIRWVIVGGNAGPDVTRLVNLSDKIELAGFVEDLPGYLSNFPVMVNPMISGSGLKNKMLEAFALRRAVVSTTIGADAIEAIPGIHYLQSDQPQTMARQVLSLIEDDPMRKSVTDAAYEFVNRHYKWESIGQQLENLLLESKSKKPYK